MRVYSNNVIERLCIAVAFNIKLLVIYAFSFDLLPVKCIVKLLIKKKKSRFTVKFREFPMT